MPTYDIWSWDSNPASMNRDHEGEVEAEDPYKALEAWGHDYSEYDTYDEDGDQKEATVSVDYCEYYEANLEDCTPGCERCEECEGLGRVGLQATLQEAEN